jgi:hypothetical protein
VPLLCTATYGDRPPRPVTVEHKNKPATAGKEMTAVYQLTQLAAEAHRQRLAAAEAHRPAQQALALARATRRAERAERRLRRAARQTRRAQSPASPSAVTRP